MTKHILVPTDGSKLSLKAAKEAASLARSLKAKVTALYVVEPWMPPILMEGQVLRGTFAENQAAYSAATEKVAQVALKKVQMAVAGDRVKCDAVSFTANKPWEGIITVAKRKKCDLVVMASHGRGVIAGALLGSVTAKVLSESKIPVLVCR